MRICVFCGSSDGTGPHYLDAARGLGETLARSGVDLVYGGASVGTMNALANGALAAGGQVIGVIPTHLVEWEVSHNGLTDLHIVDDMHERKATMARLADAFIALPGGLGTLEELFEVWTWGRLGLHSKPIGLLDVEGYFTAMSAFLEHARRAGFMREVDWQRVALDADPDRLIEKLQGFGSSSQSWSGVRPV